MHDKKMKASNIWILNKNYLNDLDIIDQDNSKGNVPQFCLYLDNPWTNFNIIFTTMMASRPATKTDHENVGQGHHLQDLCISANI